ncbi:hypothetical protein RB195_023504 [Necator americanus]|uniref:DUF5641 domain-containing protein n=1 Tax=Necator americanus TaxID=51031 RepID=A0ABR1EJH4_NECAM
MATRLVHLDVVSDLSTTAFLMMLRRFVARRGLLVSITSDNAPTFTIGETVLSECLRLAKLSLEQLSTLIIEIEELLNTRPLLYVESNSTFEQVLGPIDFLQNEFEVPYPLDDIAVDEGDPSCLPPGEQVLLRTKTQTIKALQTSCKFTEKFWQIWRDQYLLALREKHQREVGKNRSSRYSPRKDDIVLINEPVLPRHSWKMGRIHDLIMNSEGLIREAVIMLTSHRQIRRPINPLVPLELEDEKRKNDDSLVQVRGPKSPASSSTSTERIHESKNCPDSIPSSNQHTSRCNLRPRRQVDYRGILSIIPANQSATLLTILLILVIKIGDSYSDEAYQHSSSTRRIRCINGGVKLISPPHIPYHVCAAEFCRFYGDPQMNETMRFSPTRYITRSSSTVENHGERNHDNYRNKVSNSVTILLYLVVSGCYIFLALINGITRSTRIGHMTTTGRPDRAVDYLVHTYFCYGRNKSMTIREMDEHLANLSIFMNDKKPTTGCLENNLTLTLDGFHRQVDTAATIRVDWMHMKGDPTLTFGAPEEQVIILNRILRAASVAKEKIVRPASNYLLTS